MKVIKAPNEYVKKPGDGMTIFLAGSIEMGAAEKWQDRVTNAFKKSSLVFFNPRRDDWDSSWGQSIHNPQFSEQVNWELDRLAEADEILMYFDPNTKSPITLLELGLFATNDITVICPEGFWRKGNVDIVCKRYGIKHMNTLDEWIADLTDDLN
jgi:hypothetical protein